MSLDKTNIDILRMIIEDVMANNSLKDNLSLCRLNHVWYTLVHDSLSRNHQCLGLKENGFVLNHEGKVHQVRKVDVIKNMFPTRDINGRTVRLIKRHIIQQVMMTCPNLLFLSLPYSLLSFRVMSDIGNLAPNLVQLDLSFSRGLTQSWFPKMNMMVNLKRLLARNVEWTDFTVINLMNKCPNLEALCISSHNLTGHFLQFLPRTMRCMSIGGSGFNMWACEGLTQLNPYIKENMSDLKVTDLDSMEYNMKATFLRVLCDSFPNLKSLQFSNCYLDSNNFPFLEIRRLDQMESLRILSNVTEDIIFADIEVFRLCQNMSNLQYLQLDMIAWNLHTDPQAVFTSLAGACPKLKYLSVRKWISLKAKSLAYLTAIKSLQYIDIGQISYFNKVNLHAEVIELMSDLCHLNLRVLRLNTHFPDHDRFLAVMIVAGILAKGTPQQQFRLDLPLHSKNYETITDRMFSNPNLTIAHYGNFYNSVRKYLYEFPTEKLLPQPKEGSCIGPTMC